MGLDFSHGEASWAYIGFGVFRRALARHEGFKLNEMEGFWDNTTGVTGTRPWDAVCTPLKPLLDHSDCDGELTPQECAQATPRLREVVDALWPAWHEEADRQRGMALADAMEECARLGEPLEFM